MTDAHFAAVLDESDLDFADLADILGDHWQMTLWGCAFEDALTQEFEGGRNPLDDYLKRRGWKESAQTRSYMKALRSSVMSLYEVSKIKSGQSFLARDLLRGGEPVLVHEGQPPNRSGSGRRLLRGSLKPATVFSHVGYYPSHRKQRACSWPAYVK